MTSRARPRKRNHPGQIGDQELAVLQVLVQMHAEFSQDHGLATEFTADAITHVIGMPVTGSLAGLAMLGHIRQRSSPDGIMYSVTDKGYARFAGLDPRV